MTNEQLVRNFKETGNEIYFARLLENNKGMICNIVKRYARSDSHIHNYEELTQVANIAVFKAVQSYDESLGNKFSTLCHKSLYNEIRSYQTKDIRIERNPNHRKYSSVSLSDSKLFSNDSESNPNERIQYEDNIFTDPQNSLLREENRQEVHNLLNLASPKQKEIIHLLALGMTQTQIGHKLGVSPQCVNENLKRFRKKVALVRGK